MKLLKTQKIRKYFNRNERESQSLRIFQGSSIYELLIAGVDLGF